MISGNDRGQIGLQGMEQITGKEGIKSMDRMTVNELDGLDDRKWIEQMGGGQEIEQMDNFANLNGDGWNWKNQKRINWITKMEVWMEWTGSVDGTTEIKRINRMGRHRKG